MRVTRALFHAYRQADAKATRSFNARFKLKERHRRDARMLTALKAGSLPYTPDVMSWLSREIGKPSTRITREDVAQFLASRS
jgi:hypothetical protein